MFQCALLFRVFKKRFNKALSILINTPTVRNHLYILTKQINSIPNIYPFYISVYGGRPITQTISANSESY